MKPINQINSKDVTFNIKYNLNDDIIVNSNNVKNKNNNRRKSRPNSLLFGNNININNNCLLDNEIDNEKMFLLSSKATIIIVPDILIKQWEYQINTHIKSNICEINGFKLNSFLYVDIFMSFNKINTMPPPDVLAEYCIILVSYS